MPEEPPETPFSDLSSEPAELADEIGATEPAPPRAEAPPQPEALDLDSLPVKLLPIPAEELEHAPDKRLDADYELRLMLEGDDLRPIPNSEALLERFSQENERPRPQKEMVSNGESQNKAIEIAVEMGREDDDDTHETPVLPDDPSEQDLVEFASRHPAIKPVLKLFRGKVVSVRKKE